MIRSVVRASAVVAMLAVAACAGPDPSLIEPATRPPKGEADRALDHFELEQTIQTVARARLCQQGSGGGGASDDRSHRGLILSCPLIPGDRNVYFDLVEAFRRDVAAIATIDGESGETGDITEPKTKIFDVRGEAYRGTMSILGADGAGAFLIFVNLDLATP